MKNLLILMAIVVLGNTAQAQDYNFKYAGDTLLSILKTLDQDLDTAMIQSFLYDYDLEGMGFMTDTSLVFTAVADSLYFFLEETGASVRYLSVTANENEATFSSDNYGQKLFILYPRVKNHEGNLIADGYAYYFEPNGDFFDRVLFKNGRMVR